MKAIDAKVEATQRAQQRENELREAEAQAKKTEALATGKANAQIQEARGKAESIRIEAEAKAEANRKIAESIKNDLIKYDLTEKYKSAKEIIEKKIIKYSVKPYNGNNEKVKKQKSEKINTFIDQKYCLVLQEYRGCSCMSMDSLQYF